MLGLSRRAVLCAGTGAALVRSISPSLASTEALFPARRVRFFVPLVPGGQTDFIARVLAQHITQGTPHSAIVENRTGGNGVIALSALLREPADGHTLFVGNSNINPFNGGIFPTAPQIPSQMTGITNLIAVPSVFVVPAGIPATTLSEFITYARSNPNLRLAYGTPGVGSWSHLDMERFKRETGVDMLHVAYRGAGQMIPAILGGEVQAMLLNVGGALDLLRNEKLRALAVTWPTRIPQLPDIPTMRELGYRSHPGIWHALFAPAATPKPVIDRIFATVGEVMRRSDVQELVARNDALIDLSPSPEAFTEQARAEAAAWSSALAELNIRLE